MKKMRCLDEGFVWPSEKSCPRLLSVKLNSEDIGLQCPLGLHCYTWNISFLSFPIDDDPPSTEKYRGTRRSWCSRTWVMGETGLKKAAKLKGKTRAGMQVICSSSTSFFNLGSW
ncbi:hypothetical protein Pyn_34156 [Prunus yedoensis var. nudiflora]|uniref:Uncharacterized protein n=1 Tax=Prunus yedoensis var. nudiflora TaxID=2094558 RepID=A0A314ZI87_PRUYE|nr:hypothetical protein Pyn_34156 [Prunus yedoensis var. nudiflora]